MIVYMVVLYDFPRCSEFETSGVFGGFPIASGEGLNVCHVHTNKTNKSISQSLSQTFPNIDPWTLPYSSKLKKNPLRGLVRGFHRSFFRFFARSPWGSQKKSAPLQIPLTIIFPANSTYPRCSMYGIFTYIWAMFGVNVGKFSIHGAYGYLLHFTSGFLRHLWVPQASAG